ncbi:MAG TPA: ABC transporter substrate-binding protein [Stellaceae bacterium]|nr:ABC transporter substrate-binding protein [Stellaceae bacterium]
MRRRDFIIGSAAAAWPLTAHAQQPDRVRRIGVLIGQPEADPEAATFFSEFTQALHKVGWTAGATVQMDVRWATAEADWMQIRMLAKELVALRPDVILSHGTAVTAAFQKETQTIPIVFVIVSDPVGSGFVASLPRPGGNITGFINLEAQLGGKWLELLTEIAPSIKRAAMIFDPDTAAGRGAYYGPVFEAAALSHKVEPISSPVHNAAEIETVVTSLGRKPGGGFVVMPDHFTINHRAPLILMAARNNVPAVYWYSAYAREGGLLSYGVDNAEIFRRSASYVDRILRGAKPADLPVQVPTKYETVVNLKTAKELGLTVPPGLLVAADEVIE